MSWPLWWVPALSSPGQTCFKQKRPKAAVPLGYLGSPPSLLLSSPVRLMLAPSQTWRPSCWQAIQLLHPESIQTHSNPNVTQVFSSVRGTITTILQPQRNQVGSVCSLSQYPRLCSCYVYLMCYSDGLYILEFQEVCPPTETGKHISGYRAAGTTKQGLWFWEQTV